MSIFGFGNKKKLHKEKKEKNFYKNKLIEERKAKKN